MTIRSITVAAIAAALLMGIILPMANAQAPPCFTFDGKIQTMQCPLSFRPSPVAYYSGVQGGFSQATDDGDELPNAFFDQQTINTLRENAAQNQTATQQQQAQAQQKQEPTDEQILAQQQQLFEEQRQPTAAEPNQTASGTNLTSSDIEAVRNSLNATRESLEHNDIQAAIESINRADGAVFAILTEEGKGPVRDGLTKLSDDIDTTRKSVFNLNNEKTLQDLNAAGSQLLLITEMLSTPTATPTEEPEPQSQSQSPANQTEIIPAMPEPEPEPEPAPAQNVTITPEPIINPPTEPIIKIPLNKTQQELVTIEEIAGINKTTHEKTTISIIEGNKTTHRDVTTTEVPL